MKTNKYEISSYMQAAANKMFTQISAKEGIKKFGETAVAAILKEYPQLDK